VTLGPIFVWVDTFPAKDSFSRQRVQLETVWYCIDSRLRQKDVHIMNAATPNWSIVHGYADDSQSRPQLPRPCIACTAGSYELDMPVSTAMKICTVGCLYG